MDEAGEAATSYTRNLSDTQNEAQLKLMQENGTEVIELSADVQKAMKDACASVYDSIREQNGDDTMDLILKAAGQQ